jgi:hypothetical protein
MIGLVIVIACQFKKSFQFSNFLLVSCLETVYTMETHENTDQTK